MDRGVKFETGSQSVFEHGASRTLVTKVEPMSKEHARDRSGVKEGLPDWSQFTRRLASFGLGELPDPLLTRVPPEEKANDRPTEG